MRLSKYEKETIILTSEGDDTVQIYTFNTALKRRLAEYAEKVVKEAAEKSKAEEEKANQELADKIAGTDTEDGDEP